MIVIEALYEALQAPFEYTQDTDSGDCQDWVSQGYTHQRLDHELDDYLKQQDSIDDLVHSFAHCQISQAQAYPPYVCECSSVKQVERFLRYFHYDIKKFRHFNGKDLFTLTEDQLYRILPASQAARLYNSLNR